MKSYKKLEAQLIATIEEIMDRFNVPRAEVIAVIEDRIEGEAGNAALWDRLKKIDERIKKLEENNEM